MNFKDYIVKNYEKEFDKPAPTSLTQTLFSISANHFSIDAFAAHFNLDKNTPLGIIEFLLDPKNSYEIGKFGNRIYEAKKAAADKPFTSHRINSASDEHYDYDEGKFTKKF